MHLGSKMWHHLFKCPGTLLCATVQPMILFPPISYLVSYTHCRDQEIHKFPLTQTDVAWRQSVTRLALRVAFATASDVAARDTVDIAR